MSPIRAVWFDVEEALINETREYGIERQARLDAGLGEYLNALDLYPDVRPCLQTLRDAGYFVGNQTIRAGRFLRELNLPCDILATSDDWGMTKPSVAFFTKLIDVSGRSVEETASTMTFAPPLPQACSPSGSNVAPGASPHTSSVRPISNSTPLNNCPPS
jgi:FMN phosphatase YigB (HAD superfamily)